MTETSSLDTTDAGPSQGDPLTQCPPHLADERVELRRDTTYRWASIFPPPMLSEPEHQTTVREFSLMTDLDKTLSWKCAMAYNRDGAEVDFGNPEEAEEAAVNLYNDGEIRIWRTFGELRI